MAGTKIQTIGITRWSYPGTPDGFRSASHDLDAVRAALYAPERLEHRLLLLEHLILPCLRNQTDPDFQHIFVMGDQMPEPWRTRLTDLLATVPQIIPAFEPEGKNLILVCADLIDQHQDPACDVVAQYRLDDDDALAVNFVERLRSAFPDLEPFYRPEQRVCFDFSRGFVMDARTQNLNFIPVSARQWAPGMVIFQNAQTTRSIFHFPHLRVWHFMPTLTVREDPMFIRGIHHDNDSDIGNFGRRTRSYKFNPSSKPRFFMRKFAIDIVQIEALWRDSCESFGVKLVEPETHTHATEERKAG